MNVLLGLTGPARSGKTTVANYISERWQTRQYAFADPIRAGLCELLDLKQSDFEQYKEKPIPRYGITTRKLMTTLGTDWGRNMVSPNIWIRRAEAEWDNCKLWGSDLVVTDVRYEDEAQFIRDQGGTLVHIQRPGLERVTDHETENGVAFMDGDAIIYNDKQFTDLVEEIENIVGAIWKGTTKK